MNNPFFFGVPVSPERFFDRRTYLKRIRNRLVQDQSTALVGEPRMGKTSLLDYLSDPDRAVDLYHDHARSLVFRRIDAQVFSADLTLGGFWEHVTGALAPIVDSHGRVSATLTSAYARCRESGHSILALEDLFVALKDSGWRLVLLLDEVDLLLHHPTLATSEFFGGLRSLASNSRIGLSIVMASRQPVARLNELTQELNPTGSPFFNVFAQMTLSGFAEEDSLEVLRQADPDLHEEDRRYALSVAGGHPYLLQATAGALWDARDDGHDDAFGRRLIAGRQIYNEHQAHFADTWRVWSPFTRRAITMIGLAQACDLVAGRKYELEGLLSDLRDLGPELNELESKSLIEIAPELPGGYRLGQGAMLWWLGDELVRTMRGDRPFEDWLRDHEMVGLLTRKEIENFKSAASVVVGLLGDGAKTLMETFAKRAAGG